MVYVCMCSEAAHFIAKYNCVRMCVLNCKCSNYTHAYTYIHTESIALLTCLLAALFGVTYIIYALMSCIDIECRLFYIL